jgi:hypothetical protein
MLFRDYYRNNLVGKNLWSRPQGAWRQDELIGGKPQVLK